MGSACSSGTSHDGASDIHIDGLPIDIRVGAASRHELTLIIEQAHSSTLLSSLQSGRPACLELTLTTASKEHPTSVSMWIKSPDGSEGRLMRAFKQGEHTFTVQILAQHTMNYRVGYYLITIEGHEKVEARLNVVCHLSTNNIQYQPGGGWIAETLEQRADRLQAENKELQMLVEKQKEFILILKRKFLEKGDALTNMENALLNEKSKRVKFIINTWRQRTIVPAFQEWRKYTKEKKERKRELLGKVVLRLGNSQLWRAWRMWTGLVESYKLGGLKSALAAEKGKRAKALINAWRMRSLTPVFTEWKKFARENKERKRVLLGKVISRIQNAGLWQAFRHWSKLIEAGRIATLQQRMNDMLGRDRKKRIESFLLKWRNKTIVPKFQAWRRYAHEHRGRKRILMGKVVLRLGNAKLWSAWRQWKRSIEDDKVSSLQAQLVKHKHARAAQLIQTWRMKSLIPVFKSWKSFSTEKRQKKQQLMGKIVLRMQNAKLWAAWRQWVKVNEGMRVAAVQSNLQSTLTQQKKRRIKALMQRWQKGTITNVFRRWRVYSKEQRGRKKELLGKIVKRMAGAQVWQAYRQWKKYAENAKLDEMREKIKSELMSTIMMNGGGGPMRGNFFSSSSSGAAINSSADYTTLLTKYRSLKQKKSSLETSYDSLFKFLSKFRIQIGKSLEAEITRLTHHCKCDLCQTKRKMLSQNGIAEWFHSFDKELIKFRFPMTT